MSEARWVLGGFAAIGLLIILLPVTLLALVWNVPVPAEKGLDGTLSRIFLAAEKASSSLDQQVSSVARVLIAGLPERAARRILAASDFSCRTAPGRLDCHREHDGLSCKDDWIVELSIDRHDAVTSTSAQRRATCL